MKKLHALVTLVTVLAMLCLFVPAVMAEDYPTANVVVNGQKLNVNAFIPDGRTVVPFRAIFQALQANVNFVGLDQPIIATRGAKTIQLTIGDRQAYVDGQPVTLAVAPMIINESTYVPLRFVAEALGSSVWFDDATQTAYVQDAVQVTSGKTHEGTIKPEGETWLAAESPHFVKGNFYVSGKTSPVLTIEAGAKIYFEKDARLTIGEGAPGGIQVKGNATQKVLFTADTTSAQPGFWDGIWFESQALADKSIIEGAIIEYAGGETDWDGAVRLNSDSTVIEVTLKDVEIKSSQYVALNVIDSARLSKNSDGLKISGTRASRNGGGYPIQATGLASDSLPRGQYTDNDINAVYLWRQTDVKQNTVWRNLGIPYAIPGGNTQWIANDNSPKLTIEPGTVVVFGKDSKIEIAEDQAGTLIADAGASIDKAALDAGLANWKAWVNNPKSNIPVTNKAIVFAPWSKSPAPGAWEGINFDNGAGDQSVLNGVVVAYGGKANDDWSAGISVSCESSAKIELANSLITNSGNIGVRFWGESVEFAPGSTNNYFVANPIALRVMPSAVGSILPGQHFSANDLISIWNNAHGSNVTKTQTWLNHGVPYVVSCNVGVGGSSKPVLTIEPGTKLTFEQDSGIEVGNGGPGSLVAAGTAIDKITFTSDLERSGTWRGIVYCESAGKGNKLEYTIIEYGVNNVTLGANLGEFIMNTVIRGASEYGIYAFDINNPPDYEKPTLNNTFEDNADGNIGKW